jgi:putative flippase GtrA
VAAQTINNSYVLLCKLLLAQLVDFCRSRKYYGGTALLVCVFDLFFLPFQSRLWCWLLMILVMRNIKPWVRFAICGGITTFFHFGVVIAAVFFLHLNAGFANFCAFGLASCVSYGLNSYWTFSRSPSLDSGGRFVVVVFLGALLAFAITGFVTSVGFHYLLATLVVAVVLPPVTFLMHRFWTFK